MSVEQFPSPSSTGAAGAAGPTGPTGPTGATLIPATANTIDNVTTTGADTFLAGSILNLVGRLQTGSYAQWRMCFTKSAAGTGAITFTIRAGVNGTIADAARVTFTLGAQTAATDTGWVDIIATNTNPNTTGSLRAGLRFEHKNTTTGLATAAQVQILAVNSTGFDMTTSPFNLGISCNPGASGVFTFPVIQGVLLNGV